MMAQTIEEARAEMEQQIAALLVIAEIADCRLALAIDDIPTRDMKTRRLEYGLKFVMLSPGEAPPSGIAWHIMERHAQGWQRRSA